MNYGLTQDTIASIQEVFAKYSQIEEAILYGSRAMESYQNGSDIDITLKGEQLNLDLLFSIEYELDDLLLPYMNYLSLMAQIENPALIDHINRVGKIIYEKQSVE